MKRLCLFFYILLCTLTICAQNAWIFNRGDSLSWQPIQNMTVTFEKDPAGFFWQNLQTDNLDIVRMPIDTGDGIEFVDTPFLQAEKNYVEVTNTGNRQFVIKLKTNIADWSLISCESSLDTRLRLINTDGTNYPVIEYMFEYDPNYTGKNLKVLIEFKYSQASRFLCDEVMVESIAETIDMNKERTALMALYNATDGEHWTHNKNWGSDKPVSEWYGIYTDENGHVTDINLFNNRLNGQIPTQFFDLPLLKSLCLTNNNLYGEIPEEIGNLYFLERIQLEVCHFTGSIPRKIEQIKKLRSLMIEIETTDSFPKWLGNMGQLVQVQLSGGFQGEIPSSYNNLKELELLGLIGCNISGGIPTWVGSLPELRDLTIDNCNLSGNIPKEIGNLEKIERLDLSNNQLTGNIPEEFSQLKNLMVLDLFYNQMDGIIPEAVTTSRMWSKCSHLLTQQDGHELIVGKIYESSDYSEDGKITVLKSHTKGNGIPIIITGSAYSDRDITDGTYDRIMGKTYEAIFDIEPYTSLMDYFDVYQITAVSKNEYIGGTDVAYGVEYKDNCFFRYDDNKLKEALQLIPISENDFKRTIVVLNINEISSIVQPVCFVSDDDVSVITMPNWVDLYNGILFNGTIQHEFGHALAKLADEYVNSTEIKTFTSDLYDELDSDHERGMWLNVDYHANPNETLWNYFVSDPNYANEEIGAYEGGMADYLYGIYRPTRSSIMSDTGYEFFNAPCRWAIYQWVMKLAGLEYNFADFLEFDNKQLNTLTNQKRRSNINNSMIKNAMPITNCIQKR